MTPITRNEKPAQEKSKSPGGLWTRTTTDSPFMRPSPESCKRKSGGSQPGHKIDPMTVGRYSPPLRDSATQELRPRLTQDAPGFPD